MPTLTPAVWRPIARYRRLRDQTQHMSTLYHAVRGDRALCGVRAHHPPAHDDTPVEAPRCPECAAVPEGHYTAHDLIALGPTYRQVEYWVRRNWLKPDNPGCGSGQRMTYPPSEALMALSMWRLVEAGLTPYAAYYATKHDGKLGPGIRVVIDPKPVS
jgi:hypothetical protein